MAIISTCHYAAASFSWDPTGTILTINYDNLPNDTYTLTLFASGFENIVGIPLASNYVANFSVALGTAAFPTPFTPVPPLGDLIYTGTDDPVLVTPTDIDYLTLALNAGETLTLVATPTTSSLQHGITVLDPARNMIGLPRLRPQARRGHRDGAGRHDRNLYDRDQRRRTATSASTRSRPPQCLRQDRNVERHDRHGQDLTGNVLRPGPRRCRSAGRGGQSAEPMWSTPGDVYVSSRYYGFYFTAPDSLATSSRVNTAGQIVQVIPVSKDPYALALRRRAGSGQQHAVRRCDDQLQRLQRLGRAARVQPDHGPAGGDHRTARRSRQRRLLLPVRLQHRAPTVAFWIPQPNSGNIIHLDASYNEIGSYSRRRIHARKCVDRHRW